MLLFQLCEEHFLPSGLVTPTRYTDEATGRVIEVLLKPTRLNPGAIPSIFRNCPAYLSGPETVVRESPKEKRTPFKLRGTAGGNTAANPTTWGEGRKEYYWHIRKTFHCCQSIQRGQCLDQGDHQKPSAFLEFCASRLCVAHWRSLHAFLSFDEMQLEKQGHSLQAVISYVLSATANMLVNNLCKVENNKLTENKDRKRKLKTLQAQCCYVSISLNSKQINSSRKDAYGTRLTSLRRCT